MFKKYSVVSTGISPDTAGKRQRELLTVWMIELLMRKEPRDSACDMKFAFGRRWDSSLVVLRVSCGVAEMFE